MKQPISIVKILITTALLFALCGCGSGGGGSQSTAVTSNLTPTSVDNSYALTEDDYGLQNATYMSSESNNTGGITLRASIAEKKTFSNPADIFRIDINPPYPVSGQVNTNIQLPVNILISNGYESNQLDTVSGTINFTSYGIKPGDEVAGNFDTVVEDGNSTENPKPTYSVKGNFSFVVNTSGALIPIPSPVPVAASECYNVKCVSCHALKSNDRVSAGAAPELILHGGEITKYFTAGEPGHNGITLSAQEIHDLKILLNAN